MANYVAGWFSEIAFNILKVIVIIMGFNSEELMNTLIDVCYFDENKDGIYVLSEIVKKDKILEEDINEFSEKNINTISKMINNRIFFDKDEEFSKRTIH